MTNPVRVMIVDDEPLAHEVLKTYFSKLSGYEITGCFTSAAEAFSVLNFGKTDLLMLDINMPEIDGITLLKTLTHPPKVIFTTAYAEYAVESYSLNVIDYLLKPITFERFLKAINKASQTLKPSEERSAVLPAPETDKAQSSIMFVKSEGKLIKVDLTKLWLVEGLKNYVCLYYAQEKIIVYGTMKNFEEQLSSYPNFLRISKSYIMNLDHLQQIQGNVIKVKDKSIAIGNTYRDEVNKVLRSFKIL